MILAAGALAASMTLTLAPSAGATAAPAKARAFTCTGTISKYYTKQTVSGTYVKGKPSNVSVYDWQNTLLIFTPKPKLDPTYDGGYWTQTYGLDQWKVGKTADMAFHLMLPPPPMGSMFQALLKTDFLPNNGNWQNWMDCTSS